MIAIMSIELIAALQSMPGQQKSQGKDEPLFNQGDEVSSLFVLLAGAVHLERISESGCPTVLQRARPVSVISEASLYAERYHCRAVASALSTLWMIAKSDVRRRLARDQDFAESWAMHLAREIQRTRFQVEVMALKTVAARLDAWLDWTKGNPPQKGEWKIIASQIGVSPEALYRELARRRGQ
jgi:CRP-like cAMP-binding protein